LQILLAISLIVVAGLGGAAWYASRQRNIADANRKQAEDILDFLVYDLSADLERIGHPEIADMMRGRIDEYYRKLGPDPADAKLIAARAAAEDNTAMQELDYGNFNQALAGFRAARSIREGLARREPDDPMSLYLLAVSDAHIGNALSMLSDYAGAISSYRSSLDLMRRIKDTQEVPPVFRHQSVVVNDAIGQIYLLQGELDQAMAAYEAAAKPLQELLSRQPDFADDTVFLTDTADLYGGLGKIWMARREWSLAEQALIKSADARERLVEHSPKDREWLAKACETQDDLAQTRVNMADLHGALRAYEASLGYLDRQAALDATDAHLQNNRLATIVNIGNIQEQVSITGDAWKKANTLRREMLSLGMAIDPVAATEIARHPDD
jgi:tetratricopeptide (TPR) repeat protein